MSSGGLSEARPGGMHDVMAGHVERGKVPRIVTLVSRRGEVRVDAIGTKAVGDDPMRRDTIFRIASMTKPLAAVAPMILVEECVLRLDEPVDPLLPELADRKVLRAIDGALSDTVPANRSITLRDLLTLRPGIGACTSATTSSASRSNRSFAVPLPYVIPIPLRQDVLYASYATGCARSGPASTDASYTRRT